MAEGNTTLVVGASSQIGRALVRALDAEGAVIIAHRRCAEEDLDDLVRGCAARVFVVTADLAAPEGATALIDGARAVCEVPHGIALLAAPPLELVRFKKVTHAQLQAHLDVMVFAALDVLQHFLPKMGQRGSGKVAFVLSTVTLGAPPVGMGAYAIAKHAQLGLMRAAAAELAPKNVQINAVSPSMVRTPYLAGLPDRLVDLTAERHPLGRLATPDEVAAAVCFLLSDGASYLSGVNLPLDGGGGS